MLIKQHLVLSFVFSSVSALAFPQFQPSLEQTSIGSVSLEKRVYTGMLENAAVIATHTHLDEVRTVKQLAAMYEDNLKASAKLNEMAKMSKKGIDIRDWTYALKESTPIQAALSSAKREQTAKFVALDELETASASASSAFTQELNKLHTPREFEFYGKFTDQAKSIEMKSSEEQLAFFLRRKPTSPLIKANIEKIIAELRVKIANEKSWAKIDSKVST